MPNVTPPRTPPSQTIGYIRGTVDFNDAGEVVQIGVIPDGALIIKAMSGVLTTTLFNSSGTDLMDVGYAAHVDSAEADVVADPNAFATAMVVSSAGYLVLDEAPADFLADTNQLGVAVTASYAQSVADATAGSAQVVIAFTMPDA